MSGLAFVAGAWLLQQCALLPARQDLLLAVCATLVARGVLEGHAWRTGGLIRIRALVRVLFWLTAGFAWAAYVAQGALDDRLDSTLEARDVTIEGVIEGLPKRGERGWTMRLAIERVLDPPGIVLPPAVRLHVPDAPARRSTRMDRTGPDRDDARGGADAGVGGPGGDDVERTQRAHDDTPDQEIGSDAPWPNGTRPRAGERWRWTVRLRPPHGLVNPHGFDAELRALEEGIGAVGTVRLPHQRAVAPVRVDALARTPAALLGHLREHVRDAIVQATATASPVGQGMLVALAVGDQAALPDPVWRAFNRTGLGHLMSISGLHITMLAALAGMAASLAWRMRWIGRLGWPAYLPRQRVGLLAAVVAAGGYSLLAGWGIPAQRTFWMLAVASCTRTGNRPAPVPATLSIAAAIVTALDPWAPVAPGFWLSFGAVGALAWALSRDNAHEARPEGRGARLARRLRRTLADGAGSQAVATLALLPLSVVFFGSVSLVGPLANAVAIPLIAGMLTPAVLAGSTVAAVSPDAGGWLLGPCATLAQHVADLLMQAARWQWSAVAVPAPSALAWWLSIGAVACLLAPRAVPAARVACCALLPLLLTPRDFPEPGELRVTALDVGQGTAVLVESGRRALLYDAGPAWGADRDAGARVVLPFLRARGIDRLDALVVSHGDADHAGGVLSVLAEIPADRVATSLPDDHPIVRATAHAHQPCRRGLAWQWEQVASVWLHPDEAEPTAAGSDNARSCVLRIASAGGAVLLTGDIGAAQETRLLAREPAGRLRADVLLVPHHGSRTSSSPALLQAVAPRWAIIQAGYRNRYRHPHPMVEARYDAAGIAAFRSDRDGAVTIRLRPGLAPHVVRERWDAPRYWRVPWTIPPVAQGRAGSRPGARPGAASTPWPRG